MVVPLDKSIDTKDVFNPSVSWEMKEILEGLEIKKKGPDLYDLIEIKETRSKYRNVTVNRKDYNYKNVKYFVCRFILDGSYFIFLKKDLPKMGKDVNKRGIRLSWFKKQVKDDNSSVIEINDRNEYRKYIIFLLWLHKKIKISEIKI